ncbi:alpha/beta-hydrolase superfamily protein [Forsythia ovata]|uniref:Alpha/beta-hydrolase superfamily protein n=1 Tax=Forsythia ovata TaxID=205694 RepID=A0ABD1WW94_9LAMI
MHASFLQANTNMMAQNPAMQQKIIIQNKHGEQLVGLLHETGSTEIVIVCHGFLCTKENRIMANLAVALENEGISAFRFDFAGNGESEGSFGYSNYYREVEDLRAVVEYFNGANRTIKAILGHSKGGNIVLLYASKYHDIGAVINVSGRYDLTKGIEERLGTGFREIIRKNGFMDVKNNTGEIYRVTKESLMDRLNMNMHEACLTIDENCRVLTVHGSRDKFVSIEDAQEFDKVIANHRLQIIRGAGHGYTSHQGKLASAMLNFIKDDQP